MKVSKVIELRNPVAPAMICVSFDGQYVITFDEFDRIGLTENTVVIYGHLSGESRAFGLDDFLSAEQIESLLSVPNIRLWRVSHGIVFEGCDVRNWVKQYRVAWLPKVVVNVSRMEVRVEEPFPSSPSSPLKVDK